MNLPLFRYHSDPIASGSIVASDAKCLCCRQNRGFVYTGPVYAEKDLEDSICPWCIADGAAHRKFDAEFVDTEAFAEGAPQAAMDEISQRTPGFSSWQSEQWPVCCDDATAFVTPVGIQEIRKDFRELEGSVLSHIIYEMSISGGAATRLLNSLDREKGPTAFLFRCLHCEQPHVYVDML
jgi:uncharacterized protein CbrC (UPF0167 family)